jgi:hypothetical protein
MERAENRIVQSPFPNRGAERSGFNPLTDRN